MIGSRGCRRKSLYTLESKYCTLYVPTCCMYKKRWSFPHPGHLPLWTAEEDADAVNGGGRCWCPRLIFDRFSSQTLLCYCLSESSFGRTIGKMKVFGGYRVIFLSLQRENGFQKLQESTCRVGVCHVSGWIFCVSWIWSLNLHRAECVSHGPISIARNHLLYSAPILPSFKIQIAYKEKNPT